MRQWLLGFAFLVFSCLPTLADDWLKALLLFDAGRYEEPIALLTPLADAGDLGAQEILYAAYRNGYGVAVDDAAAVRWLEKSVAQGAPTAQAAMAHHYLEGRGVAMDSQKAVHWFTLAAQQGYAPAIHNLAVLTLAGRGVPADAEEGWRLLTWAAELDNPDALFTVGLDRLSRAGDGAAFDLALADLRRAAQLGQREAHAVLGQLYADFVEAPHHLVLSAFHYQMAADAGCVDAVAAADVAAARLSTDEVETLAYNLDKWQVEIDPRDPQPAPATCLGS
ncbi:tetratricopeptide repeat protein [Devosia sediminis]|uniref:Sel1 repeat family protein n=1 Tax=Devosia sediminis TaxID=2798801 RepID=A0A934IQA1_9HYPH|nr:tetratricopeptide repeat protein [Devosia sediminis]MBJ3784854.1 sel1 repeat family protein [Devosia sediminis]